MQNNKLRIVLLSGPIASGKSAIADGLRDKYGAQIIKTKDLISTMSGRSLDTRRKFQLAGNKLDRDTDFQWIAIALGQELEKLSNGATRDGLFVVDSIRKKEQLEVIRKAFGYDVHHIHVTAAPDELRRRYEKRARNHDTATPYEDAKKETTEKQIDGLAGFSDVVVSTDKCTAGAALVRATALLSLYPRTNAQLVDVIIGGQYGSEGKGNIVGHIAPEYDLLIRVGGPNAGHKVYAEPEPEAYFHLPSGTQRAPNAKLLLGAGAVIFPPKLMEEIAKHQLDSERLSIDPQAMIITEEHRKQEAALLGAISSTAQGVGLATALKITGRGAYQEKQAFMLAKDVPELKPYIRDGQELIAEYLLAGRRIMLEGTQGTSLSIHHGKYPFVTSRDTTVAGCLADAGIAPTNVRKVIMVCRTYPIRVGGPSGPMELEVSYEALAARSKIPLDELIATEKTTTTLKQRRLAEFDWEQLRRSVQMNGPTDIALTFVDYLDVENRKAYRFEQLSDDTLRFVEEVERISGRPVTLLSTDFDWRNIIDRRAW